MNFFTLVTTTIRLTLNNLSFPKNRDPYKKQKKKYTMYQSYQH